MRVEIRKLEKSSYIVAALSFIVKEAGPTPVVMVELVPGRPSILAGAMGDAAANGTTFSVYLAEPFSEALKSRALALYFNRGANFADDLDSDAVALAEKWYSNVKGELPKLANLGWSETAHVLARCALATYASWVVSARTLFEVKNCTVRILSFSESTNCVYIRNSEKAITVAAEPWVITESSEPTVENDLDVIERRETTLFIDSRPVRPSDFAVTPNSMSSKVAENLLRWSVATAPILTGHTPYPMYSDVNGDRWDQSNSG